jgi:hypothetical protein
MASTDELIRIARDAIGEGKSDTDWNVVPSEHAQMFEEKAPSLAKNLRGTRPKGLAEMYEEANDRAIKARDGFKKTASKTDIAVFGTASLGALLLIASGLQGLLGGFGPWAVRVIGLLGLISAGLAAMWLKQLRDGALCKRWTEERAKAEAKRLAYFKTVMEGASEAPLDQLLALEYTRRFLLDNQIDYFKDRGGQHDQAAGTALKNSTRAVFASSLFIAIAGFLSMWLPEVAGVAGVAGLGLIASAYAALTMSRSAVDQDREIASRYPAAEDQLKDRKLDVDIYRRRTASGDRRAVQEFFEPIFIALKADHQAFLSEAQQRELAIGDMGRRLDAAKEKPKEKPVNEADNG